MDTLLFHNADSKYGPNDSHNSNNPLSVDRTFVSIMYGFMKAKIQSGCDLVSGSPMVILLTASLAVSTTSFRHLR